MFRESPLYFWGLVGVYRPLYDMCYK
jgi:hypothetical protein